MDTPRKDSGPTDVVEGNGRRNKTIAWIIFGVVVFFALGLFAPWLGKGVTLVGECVGGGFFAQVVVAGIALVLSQKFPTLKAFAERAWNFPWAFLPASMPTASKWAILLGWLVLLGSIWWGVMGALRGIPPEKVPAWLIRMSESHDRY